MKDRMAVAVIAGAEARGDLRPGSTVVEYTAGTTGISLAMVCAAKGYGLHVVFSDAFSDEKRRTMEAFGATVEDVASDGGRVSEQLIKAMIARAGEPKDRAGYWWCPPPGRSPPSRLHGRHRHRGLGPALPQHGALLPPAVLDRSVEQADRKSVV